MSTPILNNTKPAWQHLLDALADLGAIGMGDHTRLKSRLSYGTIEPHELFDELRLDHEVSETLLATATLSGLHLTSARFDLEPTLQSVAERLEALIPGVMDSDRLIAYGVSGTRLLVACSNPLGLPALLEGRENFEVSYASPRMIEGQYRKLVLPEAQATPLDLQLSERDERMLAQLLEAGLIKAALLERLSPNPQGNQTPPDRLEMRLVREGMLSEQAFLEHFAKTLGLELKDYLPGEIKAKPSVLKESDAQTFRAVALDENGTELYLGDPFSLAGLRSKFPAAKITLVRDRYIEAALAVYAIAPSARGGTLAESYLALDIYSHTQLKPFFKAEAEEALIGSLKPTGQQKGQALAHFTGKKYLEPDLSEVQADIHTVVPWGQATFLNMGLMPWRFEEGRLDVLVLDPRNRHHLGKLRSFRGVSEIGEVSVTSGEHLTRIINAVHDNQGAEKLIESLRGQQVQASKDPGDSSDEGARYIETLLRDAVNRKASDIHIEPQLDQLIIKLRINRGMQAREAIRNLHAEMARKLINRIKILSGLDISETRLPQDGRMTFKQREGERGTDMRVSILPTAHGEKVVIRILGGSKIRSLSELGLASAAKERLERALRHSEGIVLICGPTGSGKTQTGYSALMHLATPDINIVSVEDPIEQHLPGVNQTGVNVAIGLTFDVVMRAHMRQDPDIIYVGEIRDTKTALIAFEASLTGHLVIATVHANDAAATIMRLEKLGVPLHAISNSLKGVLAQRLIPRICSKCGVEGQINAELVAIFKQYPGVFRKNLLIQLKAEFGNRFVVRKALPGGCKHCSYTGIEGRVPVFEMMEVGESTAEHIGAKESDTLTLRRLIRGRGVHSLRDDAVAAYLQGKIELQNVLLTPGDDTLEEFFQTPPTEIPAEDSHV